MGITSTLVTEVGELQRWRVAWDDLAVARGLPYCSPAWMLAWWRHVAPRGALLRAAVVHDGDELLAIAPFYALRRRMTWHYALLGTGTSQQREPLFGAGAIPDAGRLLAAELARADPRPDAVVLEGIATTSPGPNLLAEGWPGKTTPLVHRDLRHDNPMIALEGSCYADWLAANKRHFRKEIARVGRRLAERGGVFRLARTDDEIDLALHAFAQLHHARWERAGGSEVLDERVEAMLKEVAHHHRADLRLRLWTLAVGEEIVSVEVLAAAGGIVSCWLGGFDPSWSNCQPSIQTLLAALEHAWKTGDSRFELGPGGQGYKYRLADRVAQVERVTLVPSGPRAPLLRTEIAVRGARRRAIRSVRGRAHKQAGVGQERMGAAF